MRALDPTEKTSGFVPCRYFQWMLKKKNIKKAEGRKQVGEEGWEKEIRDSRRGGGASVPFGAANKWILKGRWGEG